MGKRGPAKTPTKILALRNSNRGKYRNPDEPDPESHVPEPPLPLKGEALRIWNYITEVIGDMGVLTVADGLTLARYCKIWVKWDDCEAEVEKNGSTYTVTTKVGGEMIRVRPAAQQASRLSDQLLRIEQEYGLTAASRASVKATRKRSGKDKGRFFGGKKGAKAG